VVFFTSDNGPSVEGGSDPAFFRSSGPLRGGKRDVYEGGIRVPMIAWGPGVLAASGETSDHVWALWDVLPTVADLVGATPPLDIDGLSMAPLLTGSGTAPTHEYLYWEFHEQGGKQAVRIGRWKGVRLDVIANPSGPIELYDLDSDLAEQTNVADEHPEVVRRMAQIMIEARTPSEAFPALNGLSAAPRPAPHQ
jgi:arylsulfatase A